MMDKVIFLDRDGVINKDPGGWTEHSYVTKWEDFHFLPGVLEALKKLKDNGFEVIIISNQGGVGKGYFSNNDLDTLNKKMIDEIKRHGGGIRAAYYCVHSSKEDCPCRKPKTGLFDMAVKELKVDIKGKYFIGDDIRDIEAGQKAGCKTIFLTCGKTSVEKLDGSDIKPVKIEKDLLHAVDWILKNG